ncbi:uncharacterized protein [Oscarella lobularis]|uniref:uncharacterized protein n=1 Tax=Oscarella lobularis TaxID=121494 RepID=UPI003313748E
MSSYPGENGEKQPILRSVHRRPLPAPSSSSGSEMDIVSGPEKEHHIPIPTQRRLPSQSENQEADLSLALATAANLLKPIKRYFLTPLGWQPWNADYEQSKALTIINYVYPILIAGFLCAGYVIQFGACYSRDHPMYILGNVSKERYKKYCNTSNSVDGSFQPNFCHHPVSHYLFSDAIHFIVFLYALYVFRHKSALEELARRADEACRAAAGYPVFLKSLKSTLRWIFVSGIVWVSLSLTSGICGVLGRMIDCTWSPNWNPGYSSWMKAEKPARMWLATVFMWIGFLLFDVVNVAVTMSYAIQCQTIIATIRCANVKVKTNVLPLEEAVKEYHMTGKAVNKLNKQMSVAVSIAEFNFGNHTILSGYALFDLVSDFSTLSSNTTKGLFIFSTITSFCLWFFIALVPFVQAIRLSNACKSPVKLATQLKTRIQREHQDTPVDEIDSFLLFLNGQNRRAKLFGVPIIGYYIYGFCAVVLFAILLSIEFIALPLDCEKFNNINPCVTAIRACLHRLHVAKILAPRGLHRDDRRERGKPWGPR